MTLSEKPNSEKSKASFRLQAKRIFLTFPQCSRKKEEAVEHLLLKFPDQLDWYIVAEEAHKDGTPHLHCALQFKEKFATRDSHAFDSIGGKHGNYQAMKSQRSCVEYVTKCGNYLVSGIDVDAVKKKQNGKAAFVAKGLLDGQTLDDIHDADPGFFLMNKRKIEEYSSWVAQRNEKKKKLPWVPLTQPDIDDLDNDADKRIAVWLMNNIKQDRPFKAKQLYIYGPTNHGKTSLVLHLAKYLQIYYPPLEEDFYDHYDDNVTDLIVWDEFSNKRRMQQMNMWLDGSTISHRKKCSTAVKKRNVPQIILSNYSLEQNYPKLYEAGLLGPLMSRLEIVEVKEFISIFQNDVGVENATE